ncbi:MAG: hypothetical protein IIZ87_01695, partial [Selenomonas sp.]|nr:hypothetical protein [Selenomonas sp.]
MAQITVNTGMNTKPVLNSISELNRQVRSLRNYVRVAGKEMDVSVVGYAKAMRNNAIASREANDRVKELNATYKDLVRQIDELGNSRIDTKEYAELKKEIESAEKGLRKLKETQQQLRDIGKDAVPTKEYQQVTRDYKNARKEGLALKEQYDV